VAIVKPADSAEQQQVRPYFVSAWVDAAFLGGISIAFFFALRFLAPAFGGSSGDALLGEPVFGQSTVEWALLAVWVVNWPHFAATSYRLYQSSDTRNQFPITSYVVPILLGALAIAALASPQGVAPWLIKVFFIWSPYHFAGQTIGLALLYARRTGFPVSPLLRWSLTWFCFAVFADTQVRFESQPDPVLFEAITIPTLNMPGWVADLTNLAVIGLGLVLAYAVIETVQRSSHRFPFILAVPVVAHLVWFKLSTSVWTLIGFFVFVNLFHSLQYLFVAWFMQMKERQAITGQTGSPMSLLADTARWGALIVLVGAFMFRGSAELIAAVTNVQYGVALAVMVATFQIHHFFVDGVIWKLRSPHVGKALATSLDELLGRP
jgi:hypothetical protein